MNLVMDEYTKKVWLFLDKIEPGRKYSVDKLATPENREKFVAAIKLYMDSLPYQGSITFNTDYSKFYRMSPLPEEALSRRGKQL